MQTRTRTYFLIALMLAGSWTVVRADSKNTDSTIADTAKVAKKIAEFELKDYRGKGHALADLRDKKAIVIYFMGTECPLAKLYAPRVQSLARQFADQGVAFLGISSNVQDSLTELAAFARKHKIEFPILKDVGNKIADRFDAKRTPEVFVLDQARSVRYRGRVDAQFTFGSGVGLAKPTAKRDDLRIALEELLAGKTVSVPVTEVKGCLIGRVRKPQKDATVTYSNQISRLIQKRCLECHRPGQIAPFSMTKYEEVAGWGEMIAEVVREQRMPPWHADPKYGHFKNANMLSKEEKKLIYEWVENGCPQGDPSELPEPRKFHTGWFLNSKDIYQVRLPKHEKIKASGVESYRYIEVDPGIKEDKWVSVAECMPGNRSIVHHIIVYVKPPAPKTQSRRRRQELYFLAGFAPGTRPLTAPKGWARRIPAGSKFVFEMHYTPIGTPQTDRSSIGLVFIDEKEVTHELQTRHAWNREFKIPAHESNFKVESKGRIPPNAVLLSMFPHMHMRGKSFTYRLTVPGKTPEKLLDVPKYDFNWQTSYILAKPLSLTQGGLIECTAYFDNSEDNLANPNPNISVGWGQQTWDEMMIGWYDIGIPRSTKSKKAASATRTDSQP